MKSAWRSQIKIVGPAARPWRKVSGPAGATIATLRRIGWRSVAPTTWQTKSGELIDLTSIAPMYLKERIDRATNDSLWEQLASKHPDLPSLAKGAWIYPLREVILGKDIINGGCTRSVAIGGQWPQQRLEQQGYVSDSRCQACLQTVGALSHRHLSCPAIEADRLQWLEPSIAIAIRQGLGGPSFRDRGLFPVTSLPTVPPVQKEIRRWMMNEPMDCLTQDVFLDGSAHQYPWFPDLCRAGWCAVQCRDGNLVGGFYGTLPGPQQTVPRAELYALRASLPFVLPPATL